MTDPVFTAFALDSTVPRGPHDGGDDDFSVVPGISIENAEGQHVAGKNMQWPSGEFAADLADEILASLGFRRTGEWTWHDWDWRASLARSGNPS